MQIHAERLPLARPFVISSGTFHEADVIVVEIAHYGTTGRGEASGVFFIGETSGSMIADAQSVRDAIEAGADRAALQQLLDPCGARNAIDCALWELEARGSGRSVAELAGVPSMPLTTVATIGLADPQAMAAQAAGLNDFGVLKLKLGAEDPVARVRAVREARPDARLIVDVNAGWSVPELRAHAPRCAVLGVEMIEQPCRPEDDARIVQANFTIPICADESCSTTVDLDRLNGHFGMINIKLDKTGGLTGALALARAARARGFELMLGNMVGTSLAMAPASLLGSMCRYVDLDGPLLLARDREPAMPIRGETIAPMVPAIWG